MGSKRWLWEWLCCSNKWEVMPSRKFPNRNDFQPVCPTCGYKPSRKWIEMRYGQ